MLENSLNKMGWESYTGGELKQISDGLSVQQLTEQRFWKSNINQQTENLLLSL